MSQVQSISSKSFCARLGAGEAMHVLDVRTDIEHKSGCLSCAHEHVPMHELDVEAWVKAHPEAKTQPVYVLCAAGKRAEKVAERLGAQGVNAVVIEGGLGACTIDGVAIRQTQVISLERQVRIAAGAIILLGAILGTFISIGFFVITAFVGLGLVIAGITQFCGMAMLLARAPWNRDRKKEAIAASVKQFEQKA